MQSKNVLGRTFSMFNNNHKTIQYSITVHTQILNESDVIKCLRKRAHEYKLNTIFYSVSHFIENPTARKKKFILFCGLRTKKVVGVFTWEGFKTLFGIKMNSK